MVNKHFRHHHQAMDLLLAANLSTSLLLLDDNNSLDSGGGGGGSNRNSLELGGDPSQRPRMELAATEGDLLENISLRCLFFHQFLFFSKLRVFLAVKR